MKKREAVAYRKFFYFSENDNLMEELRKTSVYDLINVWIDLTRPNTQHISDSNSTKWHSSLGYNKCIENVEIVISEKLEITLLEVKIMSNSKKKVIDLTEAKLFKSRKRKATEQKTQKYPTKLSQGMGTIQQEIFHAHQAVCKLDNMTNNEEEDDVFL